MQDDKLRGIVTRMVEAGESEDNIAAVIKRYKETTAPTTGQAQAAPQKQPEGLKVSFNDLASKGPSAIPMERRGEAAKTVDPVSTGAMAAGAAAAPFTGGSSLMGAMALTGAASGAGGAAGNVLKQATGDKPFSMTGLMRDAAAQGLAGAAGTGVAGGITGTLKLLGRGLYRAAALPINKMTKYGDLIDEGLSNRVPVSKSGLAKAEGIKSERMGKKTAALAEADEKVTYQAKGIADDAKGKLKGKADDLEGAGEGDVLDTLKKPIDRFAAKNPNGTLTPSKLEQHKRTLDDRLGGAYQKLRKKEPLSPREMSRMELSQAASRAQESVIPGYREMNKGISNAEGLRQMIGRRVDPQSSGGNQGLENAITMLGGLSAVPARLAMLPPVLSRIGIVANEGGKLSQAAQPSTGMLLRALLAQLAGSSEQQ